MDIATLYEAWKRAHEAGDVAYEKNRGEEASRLWGEAWDAGDELRALPAERIADVIVQLDTLFGDREADQLGEEDFAFLVKVRDDLARIDGRE